MCVCVCVYVCVCVCVYVRVCVCANVSVNSPMETSSLQHSSPPNSLPAECFHQLNFDLLHQPFDRLTPKYRE